MDHHIEHNKGRDITANSVHGSLKLCSCEPGSCFHGNFEKYLKPHVPTMNLGAYYYTQSHLDGLGHCICRQRIKYQHWVVDKDTGDRYCVGSSCVKRLLGIDMVPDKEIIVSDETIKDKISIPHCLYNSVPDNKKDQLHCILSKARTIILELYNKSLFRGKYNTYKYAPLVVKYIVGEICKDTLISTTESYVEFFDDALMKDGFETIKMIMDKGSNKQGDMYYYWQLHDIVKTCPQLVDEFKLEVFSGEEHTYKELRQMGYTVSWHQERLYNIYCETMNDLEQN